MAITYTWIKKSLAQDEFGECTKAKWGLEGIDDVSGKSARHEAATVFGGVDIKDKADWTQAEIDAFAEKIRVSCNFDQEIDDQIAAQV